MQFVGRTVSINPVSPVALAGRGGGKTARIARTVHDGLEANVVVLRQHDTLIVMVSIDSLFVGPEISKAVIDACAEKGVPSANVVIVASHTHSAPALEAGKPLLGACDASHQQDVLRKVVALVVEALEAAADHGEITVGRAAVVAGVNRRLRYNLPQLSRKGVHFDKVVMAPNYSGPTDKEVVALVLRGNRSSVVLWHLACHPTGFPDCGAISADFPGVVRRALRREYGGSTAVIFLQGFAGDIRPPSGIPPHSLRESIRVAVQGPHFFDMSMQCWEAWARGIARATVQAALGGVLAEECNLDSRHAAIPLSALLIGAPDSRAIEAQRLKIPGVEIITLSAEPLVELKEFCPLGALAVGYSRDAFGYWPRTKELRLGGYEVDGFKKWFEVQYPWCSTPDEVFQTLIGSI